MPSLAMDRPAHAGLGAEKLSAFLGTVSPPRKLRRLDAPIKTVVSTRPQHLPEAETGGGRGTRGNHAAQQ